MLTIAICDDDETALENIRREAEAFVETRIPQDGRNDISVRAFSDPLELMDYIDAYGCPALSLLDISMPLVSGVEIAGRIRKQSASARIIFLTASAEYAVDAFALDASHHLMKPFSKEAFLCAMERVSGVFAHSPARIAINGKGEGVTFCDAGEIGWIESIGYRRYVHTVRGVLTETRRTLSQFRAELDRLCPAQFIAPYRGYIVNLAFVRTITPKSIEMKDASRIPIKPGDFRSLKETLFRHVFGEGEEIFG